MPRLTIVDADAPTACSRFRDRHPEACLVADIDFKKGPVGAALREMNADGGSDISAVYVGEEAAGAAVADAINVRQHVEREGMSKIPIFVIYSPA